MTGFSSTAPRVAIFVRIESTPPLCLWVGFGDIDVPANDLDVDQQRYQGLGGIADIPELEQLLNGVAGRIELSISGVSSAVNAMATIALAEADFAALDGAAVNIGIAEMDAAWQLTGPPAWLWDGAADTLTVDLQAAGDTGGQSFALSLGVGTAFTGRARPDYVNWTPARQQIEHPGDLFLNHLPTTEKTAPWPGG